jgi:hypothetical protein
MADMASRIRVTLTAPVHSTVEGTVYTADPQTNLLVLNTSSTNATIISSLSMAAPAGAYRVIPISQISSYQTVSLPSQTSDGPSNAVNALDVNAVSARLAKSIATQQAVFARLGPKGTAPTDQALFEALSRTHPARWAGSSMLISDTYLIEKPYGAANVRFVEGRHGDLERMKKVIDMERSKVGLRLSKGQIDGKMASENNSSRGNATPAMKKGG